MPIYDYICTSCEHYWEHYYKIAERKIPTDEPCPECGEKTVHQTLTKPPAICDPVRVGVKKNDKGWREVLQKISAEHPKNEIKIR